MTDHPMLFSAPMVRALLAGTKTQTRRPVKSARVFATPETKPFTLKGADLDRALQNASRFRRLDGNGWFWEADAYEWQAPSERTGWMAHIGYAPSDRLYVRESWQTGMTDNGPQISYRATPDYCAIDAWDGPDEGVGPSFNNDRCPGAKFHHWLGDVLEKDGPWRPGIHMPRWASRLTLTLSDVRIQRLQDISREDAIAEGLIRMPAAGALAVEMGCDWGIEGDARCGSPISTYAALWERINGEGSWAANPWVAAYSFTVALGNIDQLARVA